MSVFGATRNELLFKIFRFLVPVQEAPVRGLKIRYKKPNGRWEDVPKLDFLELRGWEFFLRLPLGAGLAVRQFGGWTWLQKEFSSQFAAQKVDLNFRLDATAPLKIRHQGQEWRVGLDRGYENFSFAPYWKFIGKFMLQALVATLISLMVHGSLLLLAKYGNLKPLSWLENTAREKLTELSFEEQVIENAREASKTKSVPIAEDDNVIKVKFRYFNGLPWDPNRVANPAEAGQRLDKVLKDLEGIDSQLAFDEKGTADTKDLRNKMNSQAQLAKKGGVLSSLLAGRGNAKGVIPSLSSASSRDRTLSAQELKTIRARMQKLTPQMTLAFQRQLARNPKLSFSMSYEAVVDAKGLLGRPNLQVSGGQAPPEFLNDIRELFTRTSIGAEFSGVTIQGENIFRSE